MAAVADKIETLPGREYLDNFELQIVPVAKAYLSCKRFTDEAWEHVLSELVFAFP